MVTVFNRRELAVTFSMAEQVKIRAALEEAGIGCRVRAGSALGGGHTGGLGMGRSAAYEYRIYVRRKDWDLARHMIGI